MLLVAERFVNNNSDSYAITDTTLIPINKKHNIDKQRVKVAAYTPSMDATCLGSVRLLCRFPVDPLGFNTLWIQHGFNTTTLTHHKTNDICCYC